MVSINIIKEGAQIAIAIFLHLSRAQQFQQKIEKIKLSSFLLLIKGKHQKVEQHPYDTWLTLHYTHPLIVWIPIPLDIWNIGAVFEIDGMVTLLFWRQFSRFSE